MSTIADSIIVALENSKKDEFQILRAKINASKHLSKPDFTDLINLLKKNAIEILAIDNLTVKECQIIGKALLASKLNNIDEIIQSIVENKTKKSALFLNCLLNKGSKIDTTPVKKYITMMISSEIQLCHMKLLLTISKNYPSLLNSDILNYCKLNSQHPVFQEIVKRHMVEPE
ncbi:hypothetical protein GINT2_001384 [Glugoides intestinalis]